MIDHVPEICLFLLALFLLVIAGVADYYGYRSHTASSCGMYRHTITATYVSHYVSGIEEYHVVYKSQIVAATSFLDDDDFSDPLPVSDDVVPEHVYSQLHLGMVITTSTGRIDWTHFPQ